MLAPSRMSAAAQIFSNPPPAHPAMIPWSTKSFPFFILFLRLNSTLSPKLTFALSSHSASMSSRFALSSSIVYAFDGWKGRAIIGFTFERSTSTTPS